MMSWNETDNDSDIKPWCLPIEHDYSIAPGIVYSLCGIVGFVYTFFGYRLYRVSLASTGFIFITVLIYTICLQHAPNLPLGASIAISIGLGIISGVISVLLQPVGQFIIGSHIGIALAALAALITAQFYHLPTLWIPIGVMLLLWIIFGLVTIKIQKVMLILGTAVIGSALMTSCLDYFIERSYVQDFMLDSLQATVLTGIYCWYSWLVFACWPFCYIIGCVIQLRVTGYHYDHITDFEEMRQKKVQKLNLQRMRTEAQRDRQQSHYRHLYQVRRVHGDVISQTFIKNVQEHQDKQKSCTPPPSTPTTLIPSTEIADSNQTTLSHVL